LREAKDPSFSAKRQLVKTKYWLEESGIKTEGPVVDTMVLSSVLNYINYQEVIGELYSYLRDGGRLVIFNKPNRGGYTHSHLFSPNRPPDNYELIHYLENNGFEGEITKFDGIDIDDMEKLPRENKDVVQDI
jgi:hypothetical protein